MGRPAPANRRHPVPGALRGLTASAWSGMPRGSSPLAKQGLQTDERRFGMHDDIRWNAFNIRS